LALLPAGCSDRGADPADPGGGGPVAVSYAADVQPIWNASCVGCHGGTAGLELAAPGSRAALVGVASTNWPGQRVVPGDPDASVLYRKLTGDGGVGDRMPQGGALDAADIETVRRWIAEGAHDN
ncbi:MAG: hypothetical protein IH621_12790, partial [Krumholzibacteria bacterium]|nr:hypothetical protein [Candidatus Krumholzibacteria bacterium]